MAVRELFIGVCFPETTVRFTTGSRLGPYEIRGFINQGGMGEVYRARDTRLDRTVAIKVLTSARSPDRITQQRFEREARALSNLHHPHICALYDIGETADGLVSDNGDAGTSIPYLVMEYLEGQTLDDLLQKGPLSFDRVLRYGIEIADALQKAHRQHILHRDLKPSNIMITENGASLLDFGLAKIFAPQPASPFDRGAIRSDTTTEDRSLTPDGAIVGTAYYMSPEQLEGKEPDARTDIFALAICLYQMATGQRPFWGDSHAALIASILRHEPPAASSVRPNTPTSFDWLVKRCLAKDPEERFQSAGDVKLELQRIAQSETGAAGPAPKVSRLTPWFVITLLALGLVLTAYLLIKPSEVRTTSAAVRRLSIELPPQASLVSGNIEKLAVSPDGSRIAYVAGGDPPSLYLYSLEERSSKLLEHTENARSPFFSPDGRWIGFFTADGLLNKVSVDGGAPITIGRTGEVRGATWGENDQIAFGSRWSPLKLISAFGGAVSILPQQITVGSDSRWPVFLPGGQRILYTSFDLSGNHDNAHLAVFDLETRRTTMVLRGATYGRFLPPAHLIYFRSGTLFSVPFDLRTLQVTGEPAPRVSDADYYFTQGLSHFAVASDGTLFYIPRDPSASNGELVWVNRNGRITSISPARRPFRQPRLSPDGTQILVTIDEGPNAALWLYDMPRQTWARLAPIIGTAIWAPDGKSVAFSNTGSGGVNVFIMPTDGSTPPRQITQTTRWPFPSSWSPDGRNLAVVEQFKDTLTDIYIVPTGKEGAPRRFLATPFNENHPAFSPDGAWLAYQTDDSGRYEIDVTRYPEGGRRWRVSTGGGTDPDWRRDSKEIFYRNGRKFMAVDVRLGSEFVAGMPHVVFEGDTTGTYDIAADGSKFLMINRDRPAPQTQVNVVSGLAVGRR